MCFRKKSKDIHPTIECKVSPILFTMVMAATMLFEIAVVVVAVSYGVWFLIAIPCIFGVVGYIYCELLAKNTKLMFENGTLIVRKGVISAKVTKVPAVNVISISVEKGAYSRMFKYGNITITTASETYRFEKMKDPDIFVELTSKYLTNIQ